MGVLSEVGVGLKGKDKEMTSTRDSNKLRSLGADLSSQ